VPPFFFPFVIYYIATSRATSPTAASEAKPLNNYHLSFVNYHLKKLPTVPEKGTLTRYLRPVTRYKPKKRNKYDALLV